MCVHSFKRVLAIQKSVALRKIKCFIAHIRFSIPGHGLKMKFKLLYFKLSSTDKRVIVKSSDIDLPNKLFFYKCYIRTQAAAKHPFCLSLTPFSVATERKMERKHLLIKIKKTS